MKEFAVWTVVVIMLSAALRYIYQIYKKEINPMLSAWLIFLTGTSLSLTTYAIAENMNFKSGILNTVDVGSVLIVALSIIFLGNTSKVRFKPFEKKYLIGAACVIIFWITSNNAFVSNLLTQIIIVVGYFPIIQNLIVEKRNTESFSAWGLTFLALIVSLYPAIVGGNLLAVVYTGRAIIMISTVLSLMIFYSFKPNQ